jgi:O-antigen/teichoic acid export membrane protein
MGATPAIEKGSPRIVKNVFSTWTGYFVAFAINFFLSPYVVHHLGNTGYGTWTLISSLTGYLGLLDFGVRGAVTRYVVKFHTIQDNESASRVASSGMLIFAASGLFAIAIATGLSVFAVGKFRIPPSYYSAAQIVLVVAGLNVAASLLGGVFGGIIAALQRFDVLNGTDVFVSLCRALVIVGALHRGNGLVTLACIQLLFTVVRGVVNYALSRRLYPGLKISFARADCSHARMIFAFSVYMFLIQVSGDLIFYADTVVIGAFLPVALITFFVIGGNLVEYTRVILTGISFPLGPLASQLEAKGDVAGLKETLLTSTRLGTAVVVPILVTFMIRGGTFIGLWMGSQYIEVSGHILRILTLLMFFIAGTHLAGSVTLGIGKHKPLVLVRGLEGLCNLGLSILWVRTMGIAGVAWGTTIPGIAFCFFWPWYMHKILDIRPIQFIVDCWLRPWSCLIPFAVATYGVERWWPVSRLLMFFLQIVLILPVALAGIWFGCVDRKHREHYTAVLVQSIGRVFSRGRRTDAGEGALTPVPLGFIPRDLSSVKSNGSVEEP